MWEPWGLLGVASGLLSWVVAWTLWSTGDGREQSRFLSWFLVLAGLAWFTYSGVQHWQDDATLAYAFNVVAVVAHVLSHAAHVLFLSTTPSALGRALRWKGLRWVLAGGIVVWALLILVWTNLWLGGVYEPTALGTWGWSGGPMYGSTWWIFVVLWSYGALCGVAAFVDRKGFRDRKQAWAYLLAFVVHDGLFAAFLAMFLWFPPAPGVWSDFTGLFVWAALNVVFTLFLAYGILRAQLLDIDLHVRWGISKATVASVFLAVFFAVGLMASEFLIDELGYAVGALLAGLLFFVLRPLQRLGEWVADAAIPWASDRGAYRQVRRTEVYAAAFESAHRDGKVTEREKDVLATLAQSLGLGPADVRAIEKAVG